MGNYSYFSCNYLIIVKFNAAFSEPISLWKDDEALLSVSV